MENVILLQDQVKAARRELAMRRNVYPKWVKSGKMTQEKADQEIEAMRAICYTLKWLQIYITGGHVALIDHYNNGPMDERKND